MGQADALARLFEPPGRRLLRPSEVAEILAVDPKTVLREITSHQLRAVRVGARWRISIADLADYLERREAGACDSARGANFVQMENERPAGRPDAHETSAGGGRHDSHKA
jgi:excisionase family DNA binding protein